MFEHQVESPAFTLRTQPTSWPSSSATYCRNGAHQPQSAHARKLVRMCPALLGAKPAHKNFNRMFNLANWPPHAADYSRPRVLSAAPRSSAAVSYNEGLVSLSSQQVESPCS